MKFPGVYRLINTVNGRVYIGSSAGCIIKRGRSHVRDLRKGTHGNRHLQQSWIEYGESAFDFEIVEVIAARPYIKEYVLRREQFYLDITPSCIRMNISPTASWPYRIERTAEFKLKVGNKFRGKPLSEAHKEKLRAANKGFGLGRKLSKEICAKMSTARRGRKLSESHCNATSEGRLGIIFSDAHRRGLQLGQHIRFIRETAEKRVAKKMLK